MQVRARIVLDKAMEAVEARRCGVFVRSSSNIHDERVYFPYGTDATFPSAVTHSTTHLFASKTFSDIQIRVARLS